MTIGRKRIPKWDPIVVELRWCRKSFCVNWLGRMFVEVTMHRRRFSGDRVLVVIAKPDQGTGTM